MQQIKTLGLASLLILLSTLACNKVELNPDRLQGSYAGTFQYTKEDAKLVRTGDVELRLTEKGFLCSGNPNKIPAGGEGNFHLDEGKIVFDDIRVWTANFDWNLILDGHFDYEYDGQTLHFWRETSGNRYEYRLQRQ